MTILQLFQLCGTSNIQIIFDTICSELVTKFFPSKFYQQSGLQFRGFGYLLNQHTSFKMSKGDPYWIRRPKLFEEYEGKNEGNVNLKEAIKNYATVWSIFAALLMTVSFSLLPVSPDDCYEDNEKDFELRVTYGYIGLLLISTIFSFLAVLVGTFRYTFFDGIPASMIMDAVKASKMPGSQLFVYPAMLAQLIASMIGCYLFLGWGMFVMAAIIFLCTFVLLGMYVVISYWCSVAKLKLPKADDN